MLHQKFTQKFNDAQKSLMIRISKSYSAKRPH